MVRSARVSSLRPEARLAIEAVRGGLARAMRAAGKSHASSKGGRDLLTEADLAVEDDVRALLAGLPVIGEERGGHKPPGEGAYWLLDPICGTRAFASGIPLWCVNLALIEHRSVALSVVGDGSTGQVFAAVAGRGSWVIDGDMLRPVSASLGSDTVVVEDSKAKGERREQAAAFMASVVYLDRWYFRSIGSSLGLAFVATGRIDAYFDFHATALHSAAGVLLAREAGAVVSDVLGREWDVESTTLAVTARPELHATLIALSREIAAR